MTVERVKDWMTPNPYSVSSRTKLVNAYALMKEKNVRRLPVVDEDGLVGILTITDIRTVTPMGSLHMLQHNNVLGHTRVERVMSRDPLTVDPNDPLATASKLLMKHKYGGLPVVADGQLIGIITESDIFRYVIKSQENE